MRRTKAFGIAHRQRLLGDQSGDFDLLAAGGEPQQRAGVAHFDLAVLQHLLDLIGQFHQPHQIAHRGARASDRLGGGLMRQSELLDQTQQRAGLFQRI